MKKICLVMVGLVMLYFGSIAQTVEPTENTDSTNYKSRKLKFEEANIVSSYYKQDGYNAVVTGGKGSQYLTDFANNIDIKLTKYDKKYRLHTFTAELGVDTYTSASSDMIDLSANSSASSSDVRVYPSISWSMANEKTNNTIGLNASSSTEFDYQSYGVGASFYKTSKDGNREFGVKAQAYLDQVTLISPIELRPVGQRRNNYGTSARNTFSTSFTLSQVINKKLQMMFLLDLAKQDGLLSLPFHRVYFNNGTVKAENLPSSRFKVPVGVRANYFLNDKIVLRSFLRLYADDWGQSSITTELEAAYKINDEFTITPFYRVYAQSGTKYFAAFQKHIPTSQYFTSNYDLSRFSSGFFGAGFRYSPVNGIFGSKHINAFELRYGHYQRSAVLNSDIVSLHLKIK